MSTTRVLGGASPVARALARVAVGPAVGVAASAALALPPGTLVNRQGTLVIAGECGPFRAMAAGGTQAIGASLTGGLVRWGTWDQTGGGLEEIEGDFIAVSAGSTPGFAALRPDGSALIKRLSGYSSVPGPFAEIAFGNNAAVALTPDGQLQWVTPGVPAGAPTSGAFLDVDIGTFKAGGGIRADGTPVVWGDSLANVPVPPGTFVAISLGSSHAVALRNDGEAICWGNNVDGQCNSLAGPFVMVAAGGAQTIALRPDGTIAQWGALFQPPPAGPFVAIDAGGGYALGMRADGRIEAWGATMGALDPGQATVRTGFSTTGSYILRRDGMLEEVGTSPYGSLPELNTPGAYRDLVASWSATAALRSDGSLVMQGVGLFGETLAPLDAFTRVLAGAYHFAALDAAGEATCWGLNAWGQCDAESGPFVDLACGDYHTIALRADGTVAAWGDDFYGQSAVPSSIAAGATWAPGEEVIAVSAGTGHSIALRADGSVIGWGRNLEGQLDITGGPYVRAVAIGDSTYTIDASGTLTCFGHAVTQCPLVDDSIWTPMGGLFITTGPDCDDDSVPDFAELFAGEGDADGDGVPDACESAADLDGDGIVGAGDLALLLGAWGGSGGGDLDGDGIVGAGDMAILLGEWSA